MEALVVIGAPFAIAGILCYLLAFFGDDLVRLLLIFLSPFAVYILGWVSLHHIWDPAPGCDYECLDRLVYIVGGAAAIAGAEIGAIAGWIAAALKVRRQRRRS